MAHPNEIDLRGGFDECYEPRFEHDGPVHVSAGKEAWGEALRDDPSDQFYRVTRIPMSDKAMRTEYIRGRSLGTLVELLARGEDLYCVMVQQADTEGGQLRDVCGQKTKEVEQPG